MMDIWKNETFDEPTWTPAPNPWRVYGRVATWAMVSGLLAWGAWIGMQHMPTITFMPATARVEPAIDTPAVVAIEEPPASEKPAVATAPANSGPVIRTITTD